MTNTPHYDHWLREPYEREGRIEARMQSIENVAYNDKWLELTDELEVEKFICDHVTDEIKMLRDMIQALAVARKEHMEAWGNEQERNGAGKAARLKAYHRINALLDMEIEAYAERVAESKLWED
jgi:hypothetical protein